MLSKKEFDFLVHLDEKREMTLSVAAETLRMDCDECSEMIAALQERALISERGITDAGYAALEPYRVQRAIFMAAGFGSRMLPITINTPKPLVRVCGKRMIETLLDAVIAAGIPEIYVIRGYLGEQFDQLLEQYPMIRFIDNPYYNESNNIGSLYCAGELLRNAYILEADLVLTNPKLIRKYQYQSNYLGIPVDQTDDWCFHLKDGIIQSVGIGGENCHQIIGVSYWTEEDGARFAKHIAEVFNHPDGKQTYMSHVVFVHHAGEYQVTVRECKHEDVVEIDTFAELKEKDPAYDV